MNTNTPISVSFLNTLVQTVLPVLPPPIREAAIAALPELRVRFGRLGLEVLDAEQRGLNFAAAVRQPHFPIMSAVYHGAADILRWQLPAVVRDAIKPLLQLAADGRLDPMRQVLFAFARDRDHPEPALGRFLLWCALLLNLRIHTWEHPRVEAFGVLAAMEDEAERSLKELLDVADIYKSDVRPLNVLVIALLEHSRLITEDLWRVVLDELGAGLNELIEISEALRQTRRLNARDAATLEPLLLDPSIGSQQIADRYAQHYTTAQAVDSQRSRVLRKLGTGRYQHVDDRLIDLIRPSTGVSE